MIINPVLSSSERLQMLFLKLDEETQMHSLRVGMYCELIYSYYFKKIRNISQEDSYSVLGIRRGGIFHDIGKIYFTKDMMKHAKLSDEEKKLIVQHPVYGKELLNNILGHDTWYPYRRQLFDMCEGHHERWNGQGYPYGRKQKQIPLSARICAVADAYDAMVNDRCYKKSMDHETVINYLIEQSGERFDPFLIDIIKDIRLDIKKLCKRMKKISLKELRIYQIL